MPTNSPSHGKNTRVLVNEFDLSVYFRTVQLSGQAPIIDTTTFTQAAKSYIPDFIDAGADVITVHQEACRHLDRTLNLIRTSGAEAGVSINPATPVETLTAVLEIVDMVLVMSVNPGFGGQKFIPYALNKLRQLDRERQERGLDFRLEVDGGITPENVAEAVRAGADWIVAGHSVFSAADPAQRVEQMQRLAQEATLSRA